MSITTISATLEGLVASRKTADQELERAIISLRLVYEHVVMATVHMIGLDGDKADDGSALSELSEYLIVARAVLPELTLALIGLHPNGETMALTSKPALEEMFRQDARSGMESKRLAQWETETLRELVVKALAAEPQAKKGTP